MTLIKRHKPYWHLSQRLESGDLEIYGVVDYRWDGTAIKSMPSVRGIDARNILLPVDLDDLYLREKLITPFQSQMEREINERQ